MCRNFALFLPIVLGAALFAGCAHRQSLGDIQEASFARHREVAVDGESLAEYIRKRSAILIDGAHVTAGRTDPGQEELNLRLESPRPFGTAAATAVDARGYFLSTTPAVTRGPHYLIVHDGLSFRVLRARLVWRGDLSRGEPEIALLHVDRPLLFVFEWAPQWKRKQAVAGAGANFNEVDGRLLSVFGGRLTRFSTRDPQGAPTVSFFHDAPVHPGDTGGPLTDQEGKLLGVNLDTLRRFSFQRMSYRINARAFRPNAAWLRELIDRDFQRQLRAPPPTPARSTPSA